MLAHRCKNVSGLEDRLSNIEAEMSSMNNFFKTARNQRLPFEPCTEDVFSGEGSVIDPLEEDGQSLAASERHIIQTVSNSTDHHHGPCTLLALCNEFCDNLLSAQNIQNSNRGHNESQLAAKSPSPNVTIGVKGLLDRIRLEAGSCESFDLQTDPVPIRLPPKQFLLMAQTQFFQQADYGMDIFVQSHFSSNVERVYSGPFTPTDEAWAICFNTIILLVLGPESPNHDGDSLIGSQFVRPFLMIVRSALNNPHILMAAKLVNVQALALLVSTHVMTRTLIYCHDD